MDTQVHKLRLKGFSILHSVFGTEVWNFYMIFKMCETSVYALTHPLSLVKLNLDDGKVEVSGGGLNDTYSTIQLHFHWGDTEYHPGSEHKIDGQRYPMEVQYCSAFTIENMHLLVF